ncbi:PDZ and LIM domain protein 2 [Nothoprocta perdicaria]|uniref:PDZ and LIM domain protein 2 n=1 Tax=Nothoprocta perdicaria TaxID=30464 RepID=UPI000E1B9633|nr:PDZ and LIM domain protein 2 [Nothoprocta perdicaria]
MSVTVTLAGPAPWGFRISGGRDFGKPIAVSQVAERGKAAAGGLRPGDVIVSINGERAGAMLHVEARNRIKQSAGPLRLQLERCPAPSPGHANGESSPERLAARFQDAVRTREQSRGCPSASYCSPASLGPRPGSPGPAGSPSSVPGIPMDPPAPGPLQQERGRPGSSPAPGPPPSPGVRAPPSPWNVPGWASPEPRSSPVSAPAVRRPPDPSDAARTPAEPRRPPRQSSTFRLLQEALAEGGAAGPAAPLPGRLSPGARPPAPPKLHECEKCGGTIATQAVRIRAGRYRHASCYACADCGLNLRPRGHFWAGDELYCEKHAGLRYRGPPRPSAAHTQHGI